MALERNEILAAIKDKIVELAARIGGDGGALDEDELIPATGLLDSGALLELMVWYEDYFDIAVKQEDITIDNFGTLSLMADYVLSRKAV